MRATLVHSLLLTKRTSKAKSGTIQFVKTFLQNLMHSAGGYGCDFREGP